MRCAAKFADGCAPNGKRQRTAGYTAKAAGYSIKQAGLAGGEVADASNEVRMLLHSWMSERGV